MYLLIENARKNLTTHGVLHGFSITYMKKNADVLTEEKLIDEIIGQDASFGWYFLYIPKGRYPDINLEIENKCIPCCIIDNPNVLREAVEKFNMEPALPGEEELIKGKTARFLDKYSQEVKKVTQDFWEDLKKGKLNTENVKLSKVIENYERRNRQRVYFEKKIYS